LNLNIIFTWISLMGNDAEYFFLYLSAICGFFSFENYLFNSFAYLLIGLFVLWYLNFKLLYILDDNPLSDK
jgi:hypothetical protein